MIKKQKDLVAGDVIRVEYGIEGNWIVVTVDKVLNDTSKYYGSHMLCHYKSGQILSMWGQLNDDVEVLTNENN